jgi:hypothetical protein
MELVELFSLKVDRVTLLLPSRDGLSPRPDRPDERVVGSLIPSLRVVQANICTLH